MKKIIAVALLFVMVCSLNFVQAEIKGYDEKTRTYQYVAFGQYPQGAEGEIKPILWRVLEADDEKVYLLSEYILFAKAVHSVYLEFHNDFKLDVRKTEMFLHLNDGFMKEAFTAEQQMKMVEEPEHGWVSLPSVADIKNPAYGFVEDKDRRGYGTPYALNHLLFMYGNESSPYWTRDYSTSQDGSMRCTKVQGNTGFIRCQSIDLGARPVIWLKTAALMEATGEGTRENPFIME